MRSTAEDMPRALEASLARLGRPVVDLYLHHFPAKRVDIPRLMGLMADAVDAGKVRAVGVSNYSAEQMRIAHAALADRGVPLASNQVEYSLLHRQPETDGVLDTCRELGVTLIAYQPLASGALTGKYLAGNRPAGLRRFMPLFRRNRRESLASVVALLREIGDRHGTGPTQVAIRWLIENNSVLPIPGAKNATQAVANAGDRQDRVVLDQPPDRDLGRAGAVAVTDLSKQRDHRRERLPSVPAEEGHEAAQARRPVPSQILAGQRSAGQGLVGDECHAQLAAGVQHAVGLGQGKHQRVLHLVGRKRDTPIGQRCVGDPHLVG